MRTREKSYADYGITPAESNEILDFCKTEGAQDTIKAALIVVPSRYTAELLFESLTEGKSYDQLNENEDLIVSKVDFYGYRRKVMAKIKETM